ncbi:unnamed protein product [Rotaria socialis]|uniref:B30.2/SPRY domain-containing protein n=1 Tax=Rotaria socialis TaxID=392032 RepID=A0A820TBP8_9BILA|nr:unnamed protein product [Rotaria socialis]CAF3179344.1 unnamed protein product [Rotaria socialis]CAF3299624.1 unnamed protein product [Rotaria socialis]CAF3312302.1 unnamed protein product [Rotaria socialis]CAF3741414.1 unnamed protein product [Rotaria socialis]
MTVDETALEFHEKSRSIRVHENNRLCEKKNYETYGYVKGNQSYSDGIHHIRMKFEKIESSNSNNCEWSPWIFIGLCSATDRSAYGDVRYHKLRSACGWSTNGDIWINGMGKRIQWSGIPIQNDILQLTIDCNQKLLTLVNERTHEKAKHIQIDFQDKTMFPWCFYLVFANHGYRVRLL